MKKMVIGVFVLLVMSMSSYLKVSAYDYLPYWYSDGSTISSFETDDAYFQYVDYLGNCDMPDADIIDYVDDALNTWDDLFSIDFHYSTTNVNRFDAGCISRDDATSEGVSPLAVGLANVGNKTYDYRARKPSGSVVTFYTHTGFGAYMYLIWDTTDEDIQTDDFTVEEWNTVARHEAGHLIGYLGHNPNSDQLLYYNMYTFYYINGITTPQSDDIDHVKLIYGWGD